MEILIQIVVVVVVIAVAVIANTKKPFSSGGGGASLSGLSAMHDLSTKEKKAAIESILKKDEQKENDESWEE